MNYLTILYDDQCGICSRLKAWLETQATFVPLRYMPLHSSALPQMFPGASTFHPDEKLVVIADDGNLWQGDSAWIMLLWSLECGREWSLKLASPAFRPLARRVVAAVSQNRLKLSRWLKLRADSLPTEGYCRDGSCRLPPHHN